MMAALPSLYLSKIKRFAEALGMEKLSSNPQECLDEVIGFLRDLRHQIGLPDTFAEFNLDADALQNLAVEGLVRSKFASNDQQCVCPNRIYVQEGIYAEFAEKLKEKIGSMKVGNGLDEQNDMGALINEEAIGMLRSFPRRKLNEESFFISSY